MNALQKLFRLSASVFSLAALPFAIPLQQTEPGSDEPQIHITQVDESQFPQIKVYVSATDSAGEPVGVSPNQLVLSENGTPLKIDQIGGEGEIGPLTTLLVVDISGSMNEGGKLEAAKQAALTYINQMRPGDQAGLLTFNTEINYVQPVTTDREALTNAINGLKAKQDTMMYDALLTGTEILSSLGGRKAIIVLADGLDNRSTSTVDQVTEAIGPGGLTISTIGLGNADQLGITNQGLDVAALQTLAERAGGRYGYAQDPETLTHLYEQFGRALQSEYVITFTAPNTLRDGVNRNFTVSLGDATAAEAVYNPGGLVPEVPQENAWLVFGLALAILLALLFVPVLAQRRLALAQLFKPKAATAPSRVKLHEEPTASSSPKVKLR